MIIRCSNRNQAQLLEYLNKNKEVNLFFLGDIENYGISSKEVTVYMDREQEIEAAYLVYHKNLVVSSYNGKINTTFVSQLIDLYNINSINGTDEALAKLELKNFSKSPMQFAANRNYEIQDIDEEVILLKDHEQIRQYNELCRKCFDNPNPISDDDLFKEVEDKTSRIFAIIKDANVVSALRLSAETSDLVMVLGVATLKEYRGRSYATQLLKGVLNELKNNNKVACLFYNDERAAKIYHKVGFKDISEYLIMREVSDEIK